MEEPRATRLPEDWQPSDHMIEWGKSKGFSLDTMKLQTEQFVNYWVSTPGQKATKLDWNRTWQNWLLKGAKPTPPPAVKEVMEPLPTRTYRQQVVKPPTNDPAWVWRGDDRGSGYWHLPDADWRRITGRPPREISS